MNVLATYPTVEIQKHDDEQRTNHWQHGKPSWEPAVAHGFSESILIQPSGGNECKPGIFLSKLLGCE